MNDKRRKAAAFALAAAAGVLFAACGGGGSGGSAGTGTAAEAPSVPVSDARQVQIEDRIVSAFENSTTTIQYDFIKDINDGRGYTAGRAGFTTGTGDLIEVVREYERLKPGNVLTPFLPQLEKSIGSASTAGLEGLPAAWKQAATDATFRTAQDNVNERMYRQPSRQLVTQAGAVLPLTKLAIYEAGIQHGYGTNFDTINKIVERASASVGGTPATGVDEKKWLQAVLAERKKDLLAPADKTTAPAWAASVSRADAIQSIYDKGNFNLDRAITITVYGDSFSI